MESEPLETSDGHRLAADLAVPESTPLGAAVVCHPHPQFGGDRFNPVVDAVYRRLPPSGIAALRFDFRAEFGGGVGERLDVVAALDDLERRGLGPLVAVGYSFGAAVALATADERITATVAIAPPLAMMTVAAPAHPVLVLVPQHDQFTPPAEVREATTAWPSVDVRTVDSADHFLVGRSDLVATAAAEWLTARL